jgi:hypothetical protein
MQQRLLLGNAARHTAWRQPHSACSSVEKSAAMCVASAQRAQRWPHLIYCAIFIVAAVAAATAACRLRLLALAASGRRSCVCRLNVAAAACACWLLLRLYVQGRQ